MAQSAEISVRPAGKLTLLARSASMQAALSFALGGVGFAVANLLLARYMTPQEFGLVALFIALIQFGFGLGPLGMEVVVNRHHVPASARTAGRITATAAAAAVLICIVGRLAYGIDSAVLLAGLFVCVIASSLTRVAAALFQSVERFRAGLFLTQIHNYVLLAAVPLTLWLGMTADVVLWTIGAGYVATALFGWIAAAAVLPRKEVEVERSTLWREGISTLGIGLAVLIMMQAERLTIPLLLSLDEMAEYGVLAAVVAAPFRMMQLGIGFTLLPRLRVAKTRAEGKRLLRHEAMVAAGVCTAGTAAVVTLGPWIIELAVGDRYMIGIDLFAAAIIVGYVKILQAIAVAAANALSDSDTLKKMNAGSWVGLAVAALGAWALSGFGLAGLIYGVGLGWLWQSVVALRLARRAFGERFSAGAAD